MAKFKRNNLQLKTNQQIQLGDSQESLIKYDGTDLVLNPSSGALHLYNAGTKVVETISTGLQAGVDIFDIKTSTGDKGITIIDDAEVRLYFNGFNRFETTATGIKTLNSPFIITNLVDETSMVMSTNNSIELYYDNVKTVETIATGIQAGVANFDIKDSGGENAIQLRDNNGAYLYYNGERSVDVHSGGLRAGQNSFTIYTNQNEISLTCPRNLGVNLYYNGTKAFETVNFGIQVHGGTLRPNSACTMGFNFSNDEFLFDNQELFGNFTFRAGNTVGQAIDALKITNEGIEVSGDEYPGNITHSILNVFGDGTDSYTEFRGPNWVLATQQMGRIWHTDTDFYIRNYYDGGSLYLQAQVSSNQTKTILKGNPAAATELYYAGDKKFETSPDGVLVTGDLQVTGDLILDSTSALLASEVFYDKVEGATYSTAQEAMNVLGSAGVISGGAISEDSTSQISVTAGTGLIRSSNSDIAPIVFIDWPGASVDIPEDVDKTIVVKYNGGSPAVFAEDPVNVNLNNMIVLGEVATVEGELHFANTRQRAGDFNAKLLARMYETEAVARVDGMILGESADGNRYVTMTEGNVWALLEKDVIAAIDTETGDEFTEYWSDGGVGWNTSPDHTMWNMTQYDNGSGNLATLGGGRYTSRWFYLVPADNSLHMVYGIANEKDLAKASDEPAPSDLPTILGEHSVLLGRLLIQKDVTIASEVQTAFETSFDLSPATNHTNLSNLVSPADDHTQYSLVTGGRDFTGTVGGLAPVSPTDFVNLDYMVRLGTTEQRLFYNVDQTGHLDIHVEHIRDLQFADFDIDIPAPAWQEGRVFWDKVNHTFGVYNDIPEITLQVGQESHLRVRNISGEMIPDGSPVYITGADQGLPTIDLAKSDDISTLNAVSIATHNIDDTSNGYTTLTGAVNDVDTSEFNPGDTLYVSDSTAGTITNQRPKSPSIAHKVGVATEIGVMGRLVSDSHPATDQMQVLTYTLPLSGVVDNEVPLTGTFRTVGAGETGDLATDWAVQNQHAFIYVNSLTGSGVVTITGASINESTGVVDATSTETITVDAATEYYQTDKKWWDITNIDIPPGISAIDYDYGVIGYPDMGNRNFSIIGYRCDAYADKAEADFSIIINKVQDDGDKKMSIVQLEDIGVDDSVAGIVDNLRTGAMDRSYVPSVLNFWEQNTILTLKQLDFNDYFTSEENDIHSGDAHEGFFIRIEGEGGGISNVDFITLYLYYELLP
jgi:hypothetical protein